LTNKEEKVILTEIWSPESQHQTRLQATGGTCYRKENLTIRIGAHDLVNAATGVYQVRVGPTGGYFNEGVR